ncbi:hypothetical protein [Enterobacter asburiae]|nr:hypothetical protein [Enterobacter asburiae]
MKMVIQFCRLGAFADHVSEQLNSARYYFASQSLREGEGKL